MADNQLFNNVSSILGLLFEREEANLVKRERALVTRNTSMGGSTDGFRHMGAIYSDLTGVSRKRGSYKPLNRELIPLADEILKDRKVVQYDKDRIKQALTLVLRDCRSFQDMRDALPNCVKDLVPEVKRLERTRPEAFTLADNPRSYTQYMELREKIEFYVAARLLY